MRFKMLNWEDRNPRNDYKSIPWFRMDADFFRSKKLFGLPISDKWAWASLLGLAAKENKSGVIDAEPEWVANELDFPINDIHRLVETLAVRGLLSTNVESTPDVREPFGERSLRNERDERNDTDGNKDGLSPRILAELWNLHKGEKQSKVFPTTFRFGTPRWKSAKARLAEMPDPSYWEHVIKRIGASDLCNGKVKTPGKYPDGWIAKFDFILRVETHVKAMEGAYDNRQPAKSSSMRVFSEGDFE